MVQNLEIKLLFPLLIKTQKCFEIWIDKLVSTSFPSAVQYFFQSLSFKIFCHSKKKTSEYIKS